MPPNVDPNYPAMRWDPATGESDVFQTEGDVPDGWLDHHPSDEAKGGAGLKAPVVQHAASGGRRRGGKAATKDVDDLGSADDTLMTREEIVAALDEGKVRYNKEASDEDLLAQLVAALKGVLSKQGKPFAGDASPRALLALVRG